MSQKRGHNYKIQNADLRVDLNHARIIKTGNSDKHTSRKECLFVN